MGVSPFLLEIYMNEARVTEFNTQAVLLQCADRVDRAEFDFRDGVGFSRYAYAEALTAALVVIANASGREFESVLGAYCLTKHNGSVEELLDYATGLIY